VIRLRGGEGGERRPLPAQRREKARLLLLAADLEDRIGEEAARGDERAEAAVAPRELLDDQAIGDEALDPPAAIGLGKHVRSEPELGRLVHEPDLRLDVRLVHSARNRPQLALGKLMRKRYEIALLIADAETDTGHGASLG
jgi:hypothetical protein